MEPTVTTCSFIVKMPKMSPEVLWWHSEPRVDLSKFRVGKTHYQDVFGGDSCTPEQLRVKLRALEKKWDCVELDFRADYDNDKVLRAECFNLESEKAQKARIKAARAARRKWLAEGKKNGWEK